MFLWGKMVAMGNDNLSWQQYGGVPGQLGSFLSEQTLVLLVDYTPRKSLQSD
jgi:hypothetical protein